MAKGQRKALRPTWEGHLRLSLVTCPVALYTATERTADIHFNLINPKTNNRIHMQTVDAVTGEPVDRSELVRGFAVAKNKYVVVDKEELDAVKIESTRLIDIEHFVSANDIDRIYWDEPYYLAPSGKTGVEAFSVIRAAMAKENKVALGRLVLHQRERLCALEPRDSGILLTTLRTHDEIRSSGEIFDRSLPKPDARMLEIAQKIIEQQEARFDPSEFTDRYEDALRELIDRKRKGKPLVTAAEEEPEEKVVDLMDALRRSLHGGGAGREKAERFMAAHAKKKRAKTRKRGAGRKRAA
ncbi:DNA end-binding protein Ku [Enhydrobacter aerosaccus]|uniref:Non-homologous end joining protein Ku n=1 Tax=Enhydrobacter aerosaccus TaxID=225324 RepID=A0A1T4QR35_9HYPH|nr:Ku protein [Enhydrobacter aerosaccus]SKA06239.1 DNA end-binding protein Ku [Enhydrobacter aerosaccus]